MANDEHVILLYKLAEKTSAGGIDWKKSVDEDTFQVSIRKNTVQIAKIAGQPNPIYTITLLDSEGAEVESFSDFDLDLEEFGKADQKHFRTMALLFEQARRRAMGADRVMRDILKDLE